MDFAKWWSDYWQFAVGTALAAAGILAGVVIAVWQRQPKRLDYEVMNDVALLSRHERALRGKLTVEYNGVRMEAPQIVTVRIRNTGKRGVVDDDYVEPIAISYEMNPPAAVNVVDASLGVAGDLEPIFKLDAVVSVVAFAPALMNPGEWFDVQMISDGRHGEIFVRTRFADQQRPMHEIRPRPSAGTLREARLLTLTCVLLATGIVVVSLTGIGYLLWIALVPAVWVAVMAVWADPFVSSALRRFMLKRAARS